MPSVGDALASFGGDCSLGTGFAPVLAIGFAGGFATSLAGGLGGMFFAGCLATGGFAATLEAPGGGGVGLEGGRDGEGEGEIATA
jgi:hypothetical protein